MHLPLTRDVLKLSSSPFPVMYMLSPACLLVSPYSLQTLKPQIHSAPSPSDVFTQSFQTIVWIFLTVKKDHFLKLKSQNIERRSTLPRSGSKSIIVCSTSSQHLSLYPAPTPSTCCDLLAVPIPKASTATNYIYCLAESLGKFKSLFEIYTVFCCLCKNFRSIKQQ